MINKLIKAIQASQNIAIISHINPDGDTCGSALALYRAIMLFGKTPYIFCEDNLKQSLLFLKHSETYNTSNLKKFDLAISVDCADITRLGNCSSIFNYARITANIDHHKTNNNYAKINIVEPGISATAEIAYKIIVELNKIKPCFDKDVAKLLYAAIITDSGGFTYSSVGAQTHFIASKLIEYDINASEICEHFLKSIDLQTFILKNRILSKAKFFENNKIGMIFFMKDDFEATGTTENCTEGIINHIRDIDTIEVAVAISQKSEMSYKVSIRTGELIDASRIAMIFGGGGHKNAAGCLISGFFEDVKDKILKACKDNMDF